MKTIAKVFSMMYVMILTALFISKPAYAYLDPGTGSMIIQVLIGFFIAAGAMVKIYWAKIKKFFAKKNKINL